MVSPHRALRIQLRRSGITDLKIPPDAKGRILSRLSWSKVASRYSTARTRDQSGASTIISYGWEEETGGEAGSGGCGDAGMATNEVSVEKRDEMHQGKISLLN